MVAVLNGWVVTGLRLSAKMQAVITSWWKRTQDKCQYYEIDFEMDTGLGASTSTSV